MGQDNINRFDKQKQKKKKKKQEINELIFLKDKRLNKVNQKKMRNYMFAVFVVLLSSVATQDMSLIFRLIILDGTRIL